MELLPFEEIVKLQDQDFIDRNELVWKSIEALSFEQIETLATTIFKDYHTAIVDDLWLMIQRKKFEIISKKLAAIEWTAEEKELLKEMWQNFSYGDLGELLQEVFKKVINE